MTEQLINWVVCTLDADVASGDTAIVLDGDFADLPTSGTYRLVCDSEIMIVTSRTGNTVDVTRGAEGTAAAFHAATTSIGPKLTKGALLQFQTDTLALVKPTPVRVSHTSANPVQVAANDLVLVNADGVMPTFDAPDGTTTADLDFFEVSNTAGDMSAHAVTLTAIGDGWLIEDPNAAPGTFSATATLAVKSATWGWFADLTNKHWKLR